MSGRMKASDPNRNKNIAYKFASLHTYDAFNRRRVPRFRIGAEIWLAAANAAGQFHAIRAADA
jgi:hypothetical protein